MSEGHNKMKKTDDKYHVKIPVRLLVGRNPFFKCNYTKWVYTYIKLRYNYYIDNKPYSYFKLNSKEICAFFDINRSTVFECLKELVYCKLLSKGGSGKYKFLDENTIINALTEVYEESDDVKKPFIPIYYNKFSELWNCDANAKEVELYYYLVNENRHHLKEEQLLEVKTNQTQACKVLKIDHRRYKTCVKKLLDLEYLYKNSNGKLFTLNPKPIELLKNRKPATIQKKEDLDDQPEEDIDNQCEEESNSSTVEGLHDIWEKDINDRMMLDPKLGSEAKKRRLLEAVKYDVLNWRITDSAKGKYIYPIVDHPVHGRNYYDTSCAILVDKCADYGIDIKKYEVN